MSRGPSTQGLSWGVLAAARAGHLSAHGGVGTVLTALQVPLICVCPGPGGAFCLVAESRGNLGGRCPSLRLSLCASVSLFCFVKDVPTLAA